ncbi:MAG: anti-sigma-factor antagonist [Ilumatobacteraceae bacterium]|nr:anti-sigma-factor antagonist [Ilumatobacteraceae bacterium]
MTASDEGVQVDVDGRVIVVGDIDVVSASTVEASIRQAETGLADGATSVVLDVRQVGFIDSSGLRVLLAASRRNEQAGRRVLLESPGHTLTRLLDITGTAIMFDISDV